MKVWKINFTENDWKSKKIMLTDFYTILKINFLNKDCLNKI